MQAALIKAKYPLDERAYFVSETLNKAWKGMSLTDTDIFEVRHIFLNEFVIF